MRMAHIRHKRLLSILLPLMAATEFVENSSFTFSASRIASGLALSTVEFSVLLAAFATGTMLMIALQQVLARHWGYRRYLLLSLGLLLSGAFGSALSSSWKTLVFFRLLEGFGSGALFTSSRILIVHLFAREERPKALRTYIAIVFGMAATGPILAATLVEYGGWQSSFLSPIPFAVLTTIGVYQLIPPELGIHYKKVRWNTTPILMFAGAVFLLQISLAAIRVDSHIHLLPNLLLILVGGALLCYFIAHQRHHEEPLIRWHELRQSGYVTGLVLYGLYYLISNANNYLFPVFSEHVLALSLSTAGWLSSFSAAVTWMTALSYLHFAGYVPHKRWLMAGSCLLLLLSCLWLAQSPMTPTVTYLIPALVAKGMFGALMVLPLASHTFRELSDENFGGGYQSKNLIRQLAISVGTAASAFGVSHLQDSATELNESAALPVISFGLDALHSAVANVYLLLAIACGFMLLVVLLQRKLR